MSTLNKERLIQVRCFSFDDVIKRYIKILNGTPDWKYEKEEESKDHLIFMLKEINKWNSLSPKTHRWLGYVQGIMCSLGILNVQEERDITRFSLQNLENQFELFRRY